jgi:acetyl-CoA synthetase
MLNAGVIGISDEMRGEIPKAFIELADDRAETKAVVDGFQKHIWFGLAKYEYPREITFVEKHP